MREGREMYSHPGRQRKWCDQLLESLAKEGGSQVETIDDNWSSSQYTTRASDPHAQPLLVRNALSADWSAVCGDRERVLSCLLGRKKWPDGNVAHIAVRAPPGKEAGRLLSDDDVVVAHIDGSEDGHSEQVLASVLEQDESMPMMYAWGPSPVGMPSPPPWLQPQDEVRQSNIWLGRNLTSRIHVDGLDNTLCVAYGRKVVHLYSPWATARLRPRSPLRAPVESQLGSALFHPQSGGPLPARLVADLRAGDALFIPAGWWHEVFTMGAEVTLAVSFWCELVDPRVKLRPSLLFIHSKGAFGRFLEKHQGEQVEEQQAAKSLCHEGRS